MHKYSVVAVPSQRQSQSQRQTHTHTLHLLLLFNIGPGCAVVTCHLRDRHQIFHHMGSSRQFILNDRLALIQTADENIVERLLASKRIIQTYLKGLKNRLVVYRNPGTGLC